MDEAIDKKEALNNFLIQGIAEHEEPSSIYSRAAELAGLEPDEDEEGSGDETVSVLA